MSKPLLKYTVLAGLFCIPFIPFLVSSSLFFPFITTKAYAFRIIVEIIFAAWVLLALEDSAYRPRKSWTTYALAIFLIIVALADIFGVAPVKSFWSNSERMEGYITMLHLGALYLVMRGTLSEINWRRWWQTSLGASLLMFGYCCLQLSGAFPIHQGGARVDGALGNAAYLAVYMLFHIFIALIFSARSKGAWRWTYAAVALLDASMVYYSATRGAILGLMGGLLVAAFLSLRNRESRLTRKLSLAYVSVFVVVVLGFFAIRNTPFVQSSPVLVRFASITPAELSGEGRSFVWPMAVKGILERPILGWGQDNFNYIFNQYYSPEMYKIEPWFDRAHNIFLDWGTQAGILGLLAYLALYYVLLRSVWKSVRLSKTEKALLTGLVAAYFFHNIFVFDNLISYILFFALLAYVDSYTEAPVWGGEKRLGAESVTTIGAPVALVLLSLLVYFVDIQPISANMSLITALSDMQSSSAAGAAAAFESAYNEARLGRPETVEQIASNAPSLLGSSALSTDDKNNFFVFAKSAVEKQAAELPTDARYELLAGTFFESTGQFDEALQYLNRAKALTPGKQLVYEEIAGVYINTGDYADALSTLKYAYNLDTSDTDAETAYLVGAIYAGDTSTEATLKSDLLSKSPASLIDSRVTSAYASKGRYGDIVVIFQSALEKNPNDPQSYLNLAAAELKAGDKNAAIATLAQLASAMPQYASTAQQYIDQIKNGTLK